MRKFFVLFRIPVARMDQWMKDVSPEERKKQTDEMMRGWQTWQQAHAASIVDLGGPLGKTKTVTESGITDSRNDLNYYLIVEAATHQDAANILSDNPHRLIPSSQIDVMEIIERA